MDVRWLTAFIDRPADSFELAVRFWSALTRSTLSPPRGDTGEFATLLPPDGDPYLRVQRVAEGTGGTHLDLHVDDVDEFARSAIAAGAVEHRRHGGLAVLRSPAGLPWCAVAHHGEAVRPAPQEAGDTGELHLIDQLCIDIPASRFDDECEFWSRVTSWELRRSSVRSEFAYLVRPEGCPLRLMLQRCDDGAVRAHLDVASSDVETVVAHHLRLGAVAGAHFEYWTVMADPAGRPYCVTARDPVTGSLAS
ncbi:MAG TPA: VOC family protein [Egibacteraceae bacterium]|nr:VOC family protein [Egibacteraceae bacterium]